MKAYKHNKNKLYKNFLASTRCTKLRKLQRFKTTTTKTYEKHIQNSDDKTL